VARLQILELPEGSGDDRPPFILIVDRYQPLRYVQGIGEAPEVIDEFEGVAEKIGARTVLIFQDDVEIPANEPQSFEGPACADVPSCDGDCCSARNIEKELKAASEVIKRLTADREEARNWARHGYEIGQRHCGWTGHGVAPAWLTDGWPPHIESCEHLKRAADLEEAEAIRKRVAKEQKGALTDALGMDQLRDWDDIRNAAAGLRKERDAQAEALERVRNLSTEPEVMDSEQGHPTVWRAGYYHGVLAAKGATRAGQAQTARGGG
jgi:hypothetical protein